MLTWKRLGLFVTLALLLLASMGSMCECDEKTAESLYVLGTWLGNIYWGPGSMTVFSMDLKSNDALLFGFGNPAPSPKEGTWTQDGKVFTGQVPSMDKQFTGVFSSDGKQLSGKVTTVGKTYDFDATKQP